MLVSWSYLCGMLRRAAEIGLQEGVWRSADAFLVTHAQQGGKRSRYHPVWKQPFRPHAHLREERKITSQMTGQKESRMEITRLSNICLTTRKQRAMGTVAQRSRGLGNTLSSWSFRSAQPWPSGNQIQSAHSSSLSRDNILKR